MKEIKRRIFSKKNQLNNRGEARDYGKLFERVKGTYVGNLVIRDPFCGIVGNPRDSLKKFLKCIREIVPNLEKVTIYCKEQHFKDERYQPSYVVQKELSEDLRIDFPQLKDIIVNVIPFSHARSFHDRSLEFAVINSDGGSEKFHYDLSGGIDYLVDKRRDTKVYFYK